MRMLSLGMSLKTKWKAVKDGFHCGTPGRPCTCAKLKVIATTPENKCWVLFRASHRGDSKINCQGLLRSIWYFNIIKT